MLLECHKNVSGNFGRHKTETLAMLLASTKRCTVCLARSRPLVETVIDPVGGGGSSVAG